MEMTAGVIKNRPLPNRKGRIIAFAVNPRFLPKRDLTHQRSGQFSGFGNIDSLYSGGTAPDFHRTSLFKNALSSGRDIMREKKGCQGETACRIIFNEK
jgi:hypothetical protein